MKLRSSLLISLILLVVLTACGTPADTDAPTMGDVIQIVGAYDYQMIEDGTDNVYDAGSIEFKGDKSYHLVNFYEIVYEGSYTIANGGQLTTEGGIRWEGTFEDANTLRGTWVNDESSGTWIAIRQEN
jgi:hypothetical protein